MWYKVEVPKSLCDGERKIFWKMQERCKVFCEKINSFLKYLEVAIHLKNCTIVQTIKNVEKSECF